MHAVERWLRQRLLIDLYSEPARLTRTQVESQLATDSNLLAAVIETELQLDVQPVHDVEQLLARELQTRETWSL